jgi:hypothetical protein
MAGTTLNNAWPYPTDTDYVYLGAQAIEALADGIDTSTGAGLKAWTSWSPTLSGGWANGNGVWSASYAQLGKIVIARGQFTVGSTTTKGTTMNISIPITAAAGQFTAASIPPANATVAGVNTHQLFGFLTNSTTLTMSAMNASATYLTRSTITSAIPATWATSDQINFQVIYEAA